MAEALATRRWPKYKIKSVGTHVTDQRAAPQAIVIMDSHFGIDVSRHNVTSISEIDLEDYEIIVCLAANKLSYLNEKYPAHKAKIINLGVPDPLGDKEQPYLECTDQIEARLNELQNYLSSR